MRDIRMTTKELKKIEMLALVSKGEMKMAEGARKLGMTKRHLRRLIGSKIGSKEPKNRLKLFSGIGSLRAQNKPFGQEDR